MKILTLQETKGHLESPGNRKQTYIILPFKNCGLLHLSTQTFPKNNCKSLDKRRKSKKIDETTRKKVKESVRHLQSRVGQNWSGGPCPTPPVESLCSPHTDN